MLFVDSADKAARFIWTCNAFNIPLLFLSDVPGFMIGTQVERQGIIRHGAKMISAVSSATVPKLCVVVRKAYGAGLYAMAGPAFEPDATIALPTASIAVMGPQAAVNAVFFNQLQAIEDADERAARTEELRRSTREDIDILHLASELVVDAVIEPERAARRGRAALRARAGASAATGRRGATPSRPSEARSGWPARQTRIAPSSWSSPRLRSSPPPKPTSEPPAPITRWHGTITAIGLRPLAAPTAREATAAGRPLPRSRRSSRSSRRGCRAAPPRPRAGTAFRAARAAAGTRFSSPAK